MKFAVAFSILLVLTSGLAPAADASEIRSNPANSSLTEIDDCTTITEPGHYVLTSDIVNSTAKECILIRSDNVIFDGRGHLINGEGRDVGDHRIPIRIGYSDYQHVQNVTVKNVVVTEWFQGVGISRASNNTIRNVTTRRNNQYGIYLGDNAANNTVIDSVATDTIENGIFLADDSDYNRILNNTIRRNKNGISVYDSDQNLVANNTAINNTKKGIFLGSNAQNNRIRDNYVTQNPNGIRLVNESSGNVLKENTAVNNSGKGIVLARNARRNQVLGNNVSHNGRLGVQIHASHRNTLKNNTAISNTNQGYLLVNASYNILRNNTASSNNGWAYEARGTAENNTVQKFEVDGARRISFSGGSLAIQLASPTTQPPMKETLGQGFELQGLDSSDGVNLSIHLTGEDIDHINESTLEVWRYDGSWDALSNSGYNSNRRLVSATVTEDSDVIIPVYESPISPIGNGKPPNDIDSDGGYEDVNGDGEFTIVDVQLLFTERNSDAVRNNSARFDFNDDGRISIADIQRLFTMLKER